MHFADMEAARCLGDEEKKCRGHVNFPDAGFSHDLPSSVAERLLAKCQRRKSSAQLEYMSWTFSREEYDRSGPPVKIGDVDMVIQELDDFKTKEMNVHNESKNNTLTYQDAALRREQYSTSKYVFLALQQEILSKYENQITVERVLDVCRLDTREGRLVVV